MVLRMHFPRAGLVIIVCVLLSAVAHLQAAVYTGLQVTYTQPDGSTFEVRLWGDEFSVHTETTDGWTIIQDANQWWSYATSDGNGGITASNVRIGLGDPNTLRVAKHLKQSTAQRSATRVAQRARLLSAGALAGSLPAPPSGATVGSRNGVTIMVKFPDRPADAIFTSAQVDDFCNGDSYTSFGNNGSVKSYFYDTSNTTLTYTNTVYSTYYTALHDRSYYADSSITTKARIIELVTEALSALDTAGFNFNNCDANADGYIDAVNIYYAGTCPNAWSQGLWPHMNSSFTWISSGGKRVRGYQISDMTNELSLGTFCHENGHLLCGFPDLYDYDDDSAGGAANFCLMGFGGSSGTARAKNPSRISGYLSLKAGWRTVTDLTTASIGTQIITTAESGIYRFARSSATTEYFLLEGRYKAGRDLLLPASGIAIWHIDELGDHNNQNYIDNSLHQNFECALVQADNQRDLERNINRGDEYDLWYKGNSRSSTAFVDSNPYSSSANDARWWDGTASGLGLINFSSPGTSMSVDLLTPQISIVDTSVSALEGDSGSSSVTITLRRSGIATGVAAIGWHLIDGSATASGLDYLTSSGTVTWSDGEVGTKTVTVSVLGDTRFEGDESFTLHISNPNPNTIALGNDSCTVTITEDDAAPGSAGSFQFATNLIGYSEGAGVVSLTIQRIGRSTNTSVNIPWSIIGGTATPIDDYAGPTSGTLSWGATDDADKYINISIVDNAFTEADENLIFQLGAASNALATVPLPDTCILTIEDDDDTIDLASDAFDWLEPVGSPSPVLIPLRRTGALHGIVSVQYKTITGGTAIDGIDYTAITDGTVTWADGEGNAKLARITLLPDTSKDGTKTLAAEIYNPTNCTVSGPTIVNISILESPVTSTPTSNGTASSSGLGGGCGTGALGMALGLWSLTMLYRRRQR
jgi:M6 family metalloprotease-like protein